MMKFLVACLTFVLLASSTSAVLQIAAVSSSQLGLYRQFVVAASPSFAAPAAFACSGAKFSVAGGNKSLTAALDSVKFAIATPAAAVGQDMAFYVGAFAATASYDGSANTGAISASLAEAVAVISSVVVWNNTDGVPGFQYTLGTDFQCPTTGTALNDCLYPALTIDLKTLTWTIISISQVPCPAGAGYQPNCTVYSFTTTGSLSTGEAVISFTFNLATEPVYVNQVLLTPDNAEFDVRVTYPWAAKAPLPSGSLRVGLFGVTAGKVLSGSVSIAATSNSASVSFVGANGKGTAFGWKSAALVGNVSSTVYYAGVSGADLNAYQCTLGDLACIIPNLRVGLLKLSYAVYAAFGWQVQLIWFTWQDIQPAVVDWDPSMMSQATGGSGSVCASLFMIALTFVVALCQ